MKRAIASMLLAGCTPLLALAGMSAAHVEIDLSALSGPTDLELVFELYDNSGALGDTYVLIDNVAFDGVIVADFESGTLDGFDDSLSSPGSVGVVGGSLSGAGSNVMQIKEDPVFVNTLVFRDTLATTASTLAFDFALWAPSPTAGLFGYDEFVVSLVDASSLNSLITGLTPGLGDVLSIGADGTISNVTEVQVTQGPNPIPTPSATLLGLFGLGFLAAARRRGT